MAGFEDLRAELRRVRDHIESGLGNILQQYFNSTKHLPVDGFVISFEGANYTILGRKSASGRIKVMLKADDANIYFSIVSYPKRKTRRGQ